MRPVTEARQTDQRQTGAGAPHDRVWVLDDPRAGSAAQAIGIGERLGLSFRRVPLAWNWTQPAASFGRYGSLIGLSPAARRRIGLPQPRISLPGAPDWAQARPIGPDLVLSAGRHSVGPDLVLSAGRRSAAVALWLKARYGSRIVHCMTPTPAAAAAARLGLGGLAQSLRNIALGRDADAFDLLVVPAHDRPSGTEPPPDNVLPVLGAPHRLSPLLLHQHAQAWHERLAHLPHPRVALLLGGRLHGSDLPPTMAHALGRKVARLAARSGGAVFATTSARTGREATEALAAGLSPVLHLLYRWGEPDENPYHGFLASADVIVVSADSIAMISEACATGAAVYVALPELAGPAQRRLIRDLENLGQVRSLGDDLSVWPRGPLDESGRVAAEIRRRFSLD